VEKMAMLREAAAGVARYLAEELQLDAKNTETVRFVLEYFLGLFVNLGVVVGIALWLGITLYVLAAMVPSYILRLVSGGAHCSTFFRCLVLGTAIMIGLGQLTAMIGMLVPQALLFFLMAVTAAGGFYVVRKWVPADTPAKPIVSTVKKARYRRLSYIFIAVWAVVVSLWTQYGGGAPLVSMLVLASIGGVCWQIFSITPAGYRLIAKLEVLLDKFCIACQGRRLPF
jgi:accessory gene regulator B